MARADHPSFIKPDDTSARLWRYMSATRFQWMLDNSRLYMSRPLQMHANDPREGTMPDSQAAWWQSQINAEADQEKQGRLTENFDRIQKFVDMFRSSWFISCWHMGTSENFAFWRIYGREEVTCEGCERSIIQSTDAVSIVTTFKKLGDCLPEHVLLGKVRYIDFSREGENLYNMYDYIMHKREFYRYEAEVRAVASATSTMYENPVGDEISRNIVGDSYAPIIDLKLLVDAVVIHPESSETFFERVKSMCAAHSLPTPTLSGLKV